MSIVSAMFFEIIFIFITACANASADVYCTSYTISRQLRGSAPCNKCLSYRLYSNIANHTNKRIRKRFSKWENSISKSLIQYMLTKNMAAIISKNSIKSITFHSSNQPQGQYYINLFASWSPWVCNMAILCFYAKPPISIAKVQNLSENQVFFAEKVVKSSCFP